MPLTAALLTIGDEILIGQIVNTNAAWLGERLAESGVDVVRSVTVGDHASTIRAEIEASMRAADIVIATGGLGATHDDVTKHALADVFGVELREDPEVLARLRARWARMGRHLPERSRPMATLPVGFEALPNEVGAAPGLWHEAAGCIVVATPGVPHEMRHLFDAHVAQRLLARAGAGAALRRTLRTVGVGETELAEQLGELADGLGRDFDLAYLPGAGDVRVRLTVRGASAEDAHARLDALDAALRERWGDAVYGTNDEALEAVVGRMLAARGWTIATAESCTGGAIASALTDVPGASTWVLGGVVAYSNDVKMEALGVDAALIERDGAVSERVAVAMAEGVRERTGADVGLAATGIMGPGGGTPDKPVGTVWIGLATASGVDARRYVFGGSRAHNKQRTVTAALDRVRRAITT